MINIKLLCGINLTAVATALVVTKDLEITSLCGIAGVQLSISLGVFELARARYEFSSARQDHWGKVKAAMVMGGVAIFSLVYLQQIVKGISEMGSQAR